MLNIHLNFYELKPATRKAIASEIKQYSGRDATPANIAKLFDAEYNAGIDIAVYPYMLNTYCKVCDAIEDRHYCTNTNCAEWIKQIPF